MKFLKFSLLPLALLAVSLFLVACGDNPAGADAGSQNQAMRSKPDPCTLLTKAQAEGVLGVSIEQPTSQQLGPSATCKFGPQGALNFLSVSVFDHSYTKSQFEAELKSNEALCRKRFSQFQGWGTKLITLIAC